MSHFTHFTLASVFGLCLSSGASAVPIDGWFGISNNVNGANGALANTGTLLRVDAISGVAGASLVNSRPGSTLAAFGGKLFGTQALGRGKQALVELNPDTLQVIQTIGDLTDTTNPAYFHKVNAMGFSSSGQLYGVSINWQIVGGFRVPIGTLVSVNVTTGAVSQIGSTGIPTYGRGGVVANNVFYLVTNTSKSNREFKVFSIDLATGVATLIGSTGIIGNAVGVSMSLDGRLHAVLNGDFISAGATSTAIAPRSHFYELNVINGSATWIGDTGFDYVSGLTYMAYSSNCAVALSGGLQITDASFVGTYSSTSTTGSSGAWGSFCAGGSVQIGPNSTLDANLYYAGQNAIAPGAVVTGGLQPFVGSVSLPTVNTAPAQANNNNSAILYSGNNSPIKSNGSVKLSSGSLTLTSGTYWFSSLSLSNSAVLNIVGNVTIFVSGDFKVKDGARILGPANPSALSIQTTGEFKLDNAGTVYATVLAPNNQVEIEGATTFYGAVSAQSLEVEGGASLFIDPALAVP